MTSKDIFKELMDFLKYEKKRLNMRKKRLKTRQTQGGNQFVTGQIFVVKHAQENNSSNLSKKGTK